MVRRTALAAACLVLVSIVVGCGGSLEDDPILRLSAAESLAEGKALMENEKYAQAREYLTHAFEVEPNSAAGREALLLVADAFSLQGGRDNYIKAEAKYRDFQNRFPTSDRAAYVQFQIADSLASRTLSPDRDQSATRQALEAFRDVIRLFPSSEYVEEAQAKLVELRGTLAESEFVKGRFNLKLGLSKAAAARFNYLLNNFPEYPEIDKVLYFLGEAYAKQNKEEEAATARERLRAEYPESEFIGQLERLEGQGDKG